MPPCPSLMCPFQERASRSRRPKSNRKWLSNRVTRLQISMHFRRSWRVPRTRVLTAARKWRLPPTTANSLASTTKTPLCKQASWGDSQDRVITLPPSSCRLASLRLDSLPPPRFSKLIAVAEPEQPRSRGPSWEVAPFLEATAKTQDSWTSPSGQPTTSSSTLKLWTARPQSSTTHQALAWFEVTVQSATISSKSLFQRRRVTTQNFMMISLLTKVRLS